MDEKALMAQYIVLDPQQPQPDAARLVESRIPVWQIIRDLKAAKGNVLAEGRQDVAVQLRPPRMRSSGRAA